MTAPTTNGGAEATGFSAPPCHPSLLLREFAVRMSSSSSYHSLYRVRSLFSLLQRVLAYQIPYKTQHVPQLYKSLTSRLSMDSGILVLVVKSQGLPTSIPILTGQFQGNLYFLSSCRSFLFIFLFCVSASFCLFLISFTFIKSE